MAKKEQNRMVKLYREQVVPALTAEFGYTKTLTKFQNLLKLLSALGLEMLKAIQKALTLPLMNLQ